MNIAIVLATQGIQCFGLGKLWKYLGDERLVLGEFFFLTQLIYDFFHILTDQNVTERKVCCAVVTRAADHAKHINSWHQYCSNVLECEMQGLNRY